MSGALDIRPPMVIVSSVIRSADQGQSHGGVYLVDLSAGPAEQVIDWNTSKIDWEGRGGDRGLRGIAFHGDRLYLAASDEIFAYDHGFNQLGSFRNRYLRHCHEIFVSGDRLFMTSTGFDSVLEYDLLTERFIRGYLLRYGEIWKGRRRLGIRPKPTFRVFDPETEGGPSPADTSHINSVTSDGSSLYVSGVNMGTLWQIREDRLVRYAKIPYGTHNARPFREGVLLNHTATDRIAYVDRRGALLHSYPIKRYADEELEHAELPQDKARQAFGRGLAVLSDEAFVGGSSPATVTLYRFDPPEVLASASITKDVRNAVHGLEIWPFEERGAGDGSA
jgi:hypothetical protein